MVYIFGLGVRRAVRVALRRICSILGPQCFSSASFLKTARTELVIQSCSSSILLNLIPGESRFNPIGHSLSEGSKKMTSFLLFSGITLSNRWEEHTSELQSR